MLQKFVTAHKHNHPRPINHINRNYIILIVNNNIDIIKYGKSILYSPGAQICIIHNIYQNINTIFCDKTDVNVCGRVYYFILNICRTSKNNQKKTYPLTPNCRVGTQMRWLSAYQ